jgi:hypothetical protein
MDEPPSVTEGPQVRTSYRSAHEDRHGVIHKARVIVAIMLPDDDTRLEISVNGERLFMGGEEC